jgi:hypothetical protein
LTVLGFLLLGSILGGSAWMYQEGTEALSRLNLAHGAGRATDPAVPALLKEVNGWVRQLTLATSAGAGGLAVLVVMAVSWLRVRSSRRMSKYEEEATELASALEKASTELMQQRTERRRLEMDVAKINSEIEKKIQERRCNFRLPTPNCRRNSMTVARPNASWPSKPRSWSVPKTCWNSTCKRARRNCRNSNAVTSPS